jgi:flagellar hook protein FlgE
VGVGSNGLATTLGRIGLATFGNPGGLIRVGEGYRASAASGDPQLGAPATAGYGSLESGYLENSNVNLGYEFVKMMAAQAAFEANAKTFSVVDQNLKTIINLGPNGGKPAN